MYRRPRFKAHITILPTHTNLVSPLLVLQYIPQFTDITMSTMLPARNFFIILQFAKLEKISTGQLEANGLPTIVHVYEGMRSFVALPR